jgi:hypothetical protein
VGRIAADSVVKLYFASPRHEACEIQEIKTSGFPWVPVRIE